jgi:hypothetical protein
MKRALRAILIAGEEGKKAVLEGRQKVTIREGHRDYTEGAVLLGCPKLNWATMGNITSVRHTTLIEVTEDELRADGYLDKGEMYADLKKYYPKLTYNSPVTVIRWDELRSKNP